MPPVAMTRRVLGLTGAALLVARVGRSETSPPLDVTALLQTYDGQGFHRTSHLADEENAGWLAAQASSLGATVSIEEFGIDRVEPAGCFVEIAGVRIPGVPMYDAAFTGPDGIEGSFGFGDTAEIGLATLSPLSIYQPSYEAYRETKTHKALVTIAKGERPGLALFNAERFLEPYGVPDLLVASGHGPALADAAAPRRPGPRGGRCAPGAQPLCATSWPPLTGATARARPVVVMTPRSGWWHCASERGGGIACWLAVLAALRDAPPAASRHPGGVERA